MSFFWIDICEDKFRAYPYSQSLYTSMSGDQTSTFTICFLDDKISVAIHLP